VQSTKDAVNPQALVEYDVLVPVYCNGSGATVAQRSGKTSSGEQRMTHIELT
jgi:hypothetical protein